MNFKEIIIQSTKTTNGLDVEFSSFKSEQDIIELKSTLTDERSIPKIAADKDAYLIQITQNYKVYSLIVGMSDVAGRPGFYAIRLYCRRNMNISNFTEILYKIKDRYIFISSLKIAESHNYDEILNEIELKSAFNNLIFLKGVGDYVCFYEKDSESIIGESFNSKAVYLTSKLYAFQKPKEGQSLNSEFKLFTNLVSETKEKIFKGDLKLLKEIKINNQSISFDNTQNEVVVIYKNNDVLGYNLINDRVKVEKSQDSGTITLSKIVRETPSNNNKSSSNQYIGLILGCVMSLIVGFSLCYFFFPQTLSNSDNYLNDNSSYLDTSFFSIEFEEGDSTYTANQSVLKDYTFKFSDNKWFFKNNSYKNFYISTFDDFKKDSIVLSEKDKSDFINELVKASDHELSNKPKINKNESSDANKIEASKVKADSTNSKVPKNEERTVVNKSPVVKSN